MDYAWLFPALFIAAGAVVGGGLSLLKSTPDGKRWILTGRWIFGGILVAVLASLLLMHSLIAKCATFKQEAGDWTGSFTECGGYGSALVNWFAITSQWQSGLGGGLALIGLVWVAYFERKSNPGANEGGKSGS
ncbi:MAG: hypothetical protein AAGA97_05345 [Pseudomonadota bacterium]